MSPIETYGRIGLEAEETLWRIVHAAARMYGQGNVSQQSTSDAEEEAAARSPMRHG